MSLDSSALVAIVLQERDAERLLERLSGATHLAIGAATLLETGIVLSARLNEGARGLLARLLQESRMTVRSSTSAIALCTRYRWWPGNRCCASVTTSRKRTVCSYDRIGMSPLTEYRQQYRSLGHAGRTTQLRL